MLTKKKAAAPRGLPTLEFGLLANPADVTALIAKRCDEEFALMQALAENLGIADEPARWYVAKDEEERFVRSVNQGVRSMPAWGSIFAPGEVQAIWRYVISNPP
jgi:hypothetical protein